MKPSPPCRRLVILSFAAALVAAASTLPADARALPEAAPAAARLAAAPLLFELNRGQADPAAAFVAHGWRTTIELRGPEIRIAVPGGDAGGSAGVLRLRLAGADEKVTLVGRSPIAGGTSYFVGNDPAHWLAAVPTYLEVLAEAAAPGVDVAYRGSGGRLEFDLIVNPGVDPATLRLTVAGADSLSVETSGDLVARVGDRSVRLPLPAVYQEQGGARRLVTGGYVLRGPSDVGFAIGDYDRTWPLVIDPVIQYATPIGGSETDNGLAIAVTSGGEAVVAGTTKSLDFPVTGGAVQTTYGGSGQYGGDMFVAKLTASGTSFQWVTYLGGSLTDTAHSVAFDAQGNVLVAGSTESTNFPVASAYQASLQSGGTDATLTKIAANGSSLLFSTYLGGHENDVAFAVVVDGGGSACLTGSTFSTDFPVVNAYQPSFGGRIFDAFVTRFAPSGTSLLYSTYLGGSSYDLPSAIAVDTAGNLYVTGTTFSTNFPTKGAFQATAGGGSCSAGGISSNCSDAFVAKLDPSKSGAGSLVYSTYLGGTGADYGTGIAVDGSNQAVAVGSTSATNFPTVNPIQAARSGGYDAFVARLDATGAALIFSTYLGGTGYDEANGAAISGAGAVLAGLTGSTGFPTASPIQPTHGGGDGLLVLKIVAATSGSIGMSLIPVNADAFVSRVDPTGAPLTFSSFLGGSGDDSANEVTSDTAGHLYLIGNTPSTNFPFTAPAQPALGGGTDAWAARITMGPVVTADVAITKTDTPDPVTVGNQLTYTLSVVNNGPDEAASTRVVDTVPAALNGVSASSSRGSCSVAGNAVSCDLGSLAKNASATVTVHANAATGGMVTNTASVSSSAVDPTPANNSAQATTTIAGLPGSLAVTVNASATTGVAPLAVTFSASASGGTPPYTYDWNFGDGTPHASGAAPSHTFTTAGSFTVTVTVTDAVAASASATAAISVSFPASAYQYLVPGIAHAPGAGGTQWRSAVAAVNRSGAGATLALTYYSESPTRYATATLAPGAAVEWTNVLEEVFAFAPSSQTSGSLLIGSSAQLHITARTFNQTPSGTFGQYLPALTAADAIGSGTTGVLPQLRKNAAFRTNVGGVNLGAAACTVEVRLFGSTGVQVGGTKSLPIDPQRWKQQFDIFADVLAGDQDIAYAKVTVQPSGAKAWVYASVVDAATGDPTTIPVLVAAPAGPAAASPAPSGAGADPLAAELERLYGVPVHIERHDGSSAESPANATVTTERVTRTRPGPRRLPAARAQETTAVVFQDGFEGAFPGASWSLYDSGSTGWGVSTYRASEGVKSVWCTGGGVNPPVPGGNYPANMETWMVYGPFSLADASAAQVLFDLWMETELKYDYVYWLVSIDDNDYTGVRSSGSTADWQAVKFDLAEIDNPVIVGQPQVYFALVFASDVTTQLEGAYIDALRIEKTTAGPSCNVACDATVPATATVGQALAFSATATPSGCTGAPAYDWNYGDGSAHGSGASASHAYATAGTFNWTLTVTVDGATCTRSGAVTVSQPTAYVYIVPAVAHNAGLASSQWRTDVAAVNLAGTGADIDLTYYASPPVTAERTLPSGHTVEWRNLVESVFSLAAAAESKGTLHVSSSVPLFLTARTYNQGATGTFGQYLPALTAAHAIPAGKIGVLPQLKSTSAYRTNLGFVNLGAASCSVAVTLHDENGTQVGSTRTFAVDPGRWFQQSDIFGHAAAGSQDVAYATVEVQTPGGTVWAYASVADNVTSDPTTIPVLVH